MPSDPKTIESYNQHADAYDAHVSDPSDSTYHSFYEKPAMRAELPDLRGMSAISIGCGSGVDAKWLADNGAEKVVGIDISEGLIGIARKKHKGIDFHVMDMEKLAFEDESFDLAYSSLAIHYLDDWTQSLRETRRVLKPGGKYVFSCGHPIDSAMERYESDNERGNRLGRTIQKDPDHRTIHGNYLVPESDGVKLMKYTLGEASGSDLGTPLTVHSYHRTISNMIEQINASGFIIEKLVEPQPVKEMETGDPFHYEQLTKIPTFMVWVLKKS